MKPCYAWILCGCLGFGGCATSALRQQSPEETSGILESKTRLIGDVAKPFGHTPVKVEAIALITGLDGTGDDPAPSPQRSALLHELQTRGVQHPNELLASPTTSLVLVRGSLPPGVNKGDKFDLELQVPSNSETKSLRGGWLMECRMTEMAVLGGQIHEGHPLALGEGPVLVDPAAKGDDKAMLVRGRVLGGGKATRSRDLGLFISSEDKDRSVRIAAQVGQAINHRFHTFNRGVKQGVANPKTNERVDLKIHPRYKDNIYRYLRVVRSIPLHETPAEQSLRVGLLERQLLDPITAPTAALRLEAIGQEGVEPLAKAIASTDAEVRFYSAESLAYLDDSRAAEPLALAAKEEPAFRAHALAALSSMGDMAAHDALLTLLDAPSSETRYGAFRALWAMNATDPLIRGENLGGQFGYHVLSTTGPAMIHVTRSYRPEVVVFGHDQTLQTPFVLEAGKQIMIKGLESDKVVVSKFAMKQPDQKRVVTAKVDAIIRAIVELGGTYPDVVQALQQAKTTNSLAGRFEVDALPDGDRPYRHKEEAVASEAGAVVGDERIVVANPLPDLFSARKRRNAR